MATARTLALVVLLVLAGLTSSAALAGSSAGADVRTADAGVQPSMPPPTLEYGDAPDPTYPTDFASDGARHNETSYAVLGDDASTEAGPRATDTHDDGLAWVDDDTVRVDATSNYANRDVTVNVLVDRGADGDWNESGDWVVRNATGTLDAAGEATFTFDLPVSRCSYSDREPSWLRVTLTRNSVDDYDGTGSFPVGETEDYRINGSGCEGSADVFLRKGASVSTVESGEDVTYALAVENDGPNATTVSVVDDLPACMDYVASSGPGSYDPASNTWTVHLDPGETATMALTVTVDCAAGYVTNNATATANLTDPDPSNDHASTTVEVTGSQPVEPSADLVLHKQVSPPDAIQGDQVTYALTVANDGPNAATATVVDDLPACLDVESTSGPGSYAGGTWTVDLQPGEKATLALVATANCSPGTAVVNTANATGNVTDPDPADNDASATVLMIAEADVSLDKQANASTVQRGDQVTFTLRVTNHGPSPTPSAVVDDDLPSCMRFESATGPGTYDPGTHAWTVGLAPGQTAELNLVVTVTCGSGSVSNRASVDPRLMDPVVTNNVDGTTIVVVAPPADLELDKTANVSAVTVGDQVTYDLAVANEGPGPATATVVDDLPSCVDVQSTGGPGSYAGGNWTVALQPGENATLALVATVNCDVGYVTNTANATGNVTDPDATDDRANATVTVLGNRQDYLEFGDAPDPPYHTTLYNNGPYATRLASGDGPHAGDDVSYEGSANLVNEDEHDDGFVDSATTPQNLTVEVSNDAPSQNPVWVNVFVDLNDDGDWRDPGEWLVRNASVTVDGSTNVTFETTPAVRDYLAGNTTGGYTRLMVTAGAVPPDLQGGRHSPWHWGEIEDYSQAEMDDIANYDAPSIPGFTVVHVLAALGAGALLALRRR